MRSIKAKLFILGMLLLLLGCSDEIVLEQAGKKQEISLSGQIEQQYITRANDAGFAAGDQMGVYIVDYINGQSGTLTERGNRANNYLLTLNDEGRWSGNSPVYWKDTKTSIDVYGYYPYDNAVGSVSEYAFSVQSNQDAIGGDGIMGGYEKSDFLWAFAENVQPTSEVINLNFEHRLSGIKVILQQGEGFAEGQWSKLSRVVTIENTSLDARINLSTGLAVAGDVDGKSIIAASQGNDTFRAIAVPQTVPAAKSLIGITIDGISYKYLRDDATKLQAGKMHTFTLRIDRKDSGDFTLNLVNENVEPWENDNLSHNFEASAYTVVECPVEGRLHACIEESGKNPKNILNLKIIGRLNDSDFNYIRNSFTQLRSLNIYETITSGRFEVKKDFPLQTFYRQRENVMPDYALFEMDQLNHIVLPKNLETIGVSSLEGIGLAHNSTLIIPNSVKVLGNHSLSEISQGNMILPDSLEYIGDYALSRNQCSFTTPLTNNIWYIGNGAFHQFNGSISHASGYFRIPEFIVYIGEHAFSGLGENFSGELNIPNSITAIPFESFQDMHFANGTMLKFHDRLVRIEARSFSGMKYNNKIDWPSGLISIGDESFTHGNFLGGMEDFPDGLSNIGKYAFSRCKNMPENLKIPLNLSRIPHSSFSYTDINTLDITGYTEIIDSEAFAWCENLSSVKIGKYVESIGDFAFAQCEALRNISILNPEPPLLNGDPFFYCDMDHLILEVPAQSVNKYRNAPGWNKFKYITAYHELAVSSGHISCLDKGVIRNLVIRSEGEWEVTQCPSWCKLSHTESDIRNLEIILTVDPSNSTREGEIVFQLKESGYQTSCIVSQYVSNIGEDQEIVLQKATEGSVEIPLFIVGDGFTAEQIADGTYMKTMNKRMDEFFAIEPYKTYRNYFTVITSLAVSSQEGVSSVYTSVENKFNTTDDPEDGFRCDYTALRKYVNDVSEIINSNNISNTLVLVAINKNTFNGNTKILDDGFTVCFIPESPYDYPYNTRGLVQFYAGGEGFGRLASETVSHTDFIQACKCPYCKSIREFYNGTDKGWYRNISLSAIMNNVPWSHLIFDPHYSDIVDVYEGGFDHVRGVYRSENMSCMSSYIQYFNTISRELIVRRIMELSGEIYSFEKFVARDSREGLPQ